MHKAFCHYFDLLELKSCIEEEIESTARDIAQDMMTRQVIRQDVKLDNNRIARAYLKEVEVAEADEREKLDELKKKLKERRRFLKVIKAHQVAELQHQIAKIRERIEVLLEDEETAKLKQQIVAISKNLKSKKRRQLKLRVVPYEAKKDHSVQD